MKPKRKFNLFDRLTPDIAEQFKLKQFQNVGSRIVGLMFPHGRDAPALDKEIDNGDLKP